MTTMTITNEHAARREQIAADTAAFIAAGGQIQQLPYGPDEYSETATVDLNALKKEKARAKGMTQFNNRPTEENKKKKGKRSGPTDHARRVLSQATCKSPASRARAKASGFKGEAA